ncbi:MAG: MFS transporter [bacterium]|nr:MFS transporter [bacterium]
MESSARKATPREWIGLAVLAIACVLYVMDLTVLHLAVPALSADLRPTGAQLLWIIDIYGFMVAGFLVTMGSIGDRIGRRKLLMIGSACFGLVSVLAAFSNSAEMLIFTRALLGIAGATLAPSTLSLIFNMFHDPKERGIAIAVWISAFSAGSAIGPVLGGIVLEYFFWGAVFLLAVPVMALLLLLGPFVLPEYRDPKAGRTDLPSVALSLLAILPIIFAVKETAQGGLSFLTLFGLLIGLAFGVWFVRRQRSLKDPMIDVALFRNPAFTAALIVNILTVFVAFGYFLFVAQYLQLVLGLSPFVAGLWSVPPALAFIVSSNAVTRFFHGRRPAYIVGGSLAVAALGLAILSQVGGEYGLAIVVTASVLISLGLAPVFAQTTELAVSSAPRERAGAASGIAETAAELGGALGISILGSIGVALYRGAFDAAYRTGDQAALSPESLAVARDTLGAAADVAGRLPPETAAQLLAVARPAFVDGMQIVAVVCTGVAMIAALLSLTLLRQVKGAESEAEPAGD